MFKFVFGFDTVQYSTVRLTLIFMKKELKVTGSIQLLKLNFEKLKACRTFLCQSSCDKIINGLLMLSNENIYQIYSILKIIGKKCV